MENEPFYIYRPPTTSGKLEGTYFNPPQNEWKPSLSYKYRLQDIQNQFTPAESFRYTLATSGKHIRIVQRLEPLEPLNEEAYYVQACAHAALKSYDAAYETLKLLMIQVEDPCSDALRLFGFVATQMSPRLFEEAIDSFDTLVRRDNSDYHALLQRASCNACLQEWRLVVKDLNYILVFQPENIPALLLRARTYSCMREWQKATTDYNEVLKMRPQHSAAIAGLADMNHPLIELPMMSDEVMLNE